MSISPLSFFFLPKLSKGQETQKDIKQGKIITKKIIDVDVETSYEYRCELDSLSKFGPNPDYRVIKNINITKTYYILVTYDDNTQEVFISNKIHEPRNKLGKVRNDIKDIARWSYLNINHSANCNGKNLMIFDKDSSSYIMYLDCKKVTNDTRH